MKDINCVLKRAKNTKGTVEWEALYINGEKQLENYEIDIDNAISIFYKDNNVPTIIEISDENIMDNIEISFPDNEDFSYLLDYQELNICDIIKLDDGEFIVKKIWEQDRPSGDYKYYEYFNDEVTITDIHYTKHPAVYFNVIGSDKTYIWEDYNYRQSFL